MTNYIPGRQKKTKIFQKRETELKHAIKHDYPLEKIVKAAEVLREAKIQAIWVYKWKSDVTYDKKVALDTKWKAYTVEEIIAMYSKGKC